jgi:hypothetical protein
VGCKPLLQCKCKYADHYAHFSIALSLSTGWLSRPLLWIQANLTTTDETCSSCCDGNNICGFGLTCARVEGPQSQGRCIPTDQPFHPNMCGNMNLMTETMSCESCDAYSPDASMLLKLPGLQVDDARGPTSG